MDSADCCIVSDSNLKDKEEWFLDVKGHLIVSIYNMTKVKQIVGNISQCPSTLKLILAGDLNHSICYKQRQRRIGSNRNRRTFP